MDWVLVTTGTAAFCAAGLLVCYFWGIWKDSRR